MPANVTLYALSTCIHCRNTGNLLEEILGQGGFEHIYVDRLYGDQRNDTLRKLRTLNPGMSFPCTIIGDEVVVGFKEERIREVLQSE